MKYNKLTRKEKAEIQNSLEKADLIRLIRCICQSFTTDELFEKLAGRYDESLVLIVILLCYENGLITPDNMSNSIDNEHGYIYEWECHKDWERKAKELGYMFETIKKKNMTPMKRINGRKNAKLCGNKSYSVLIEGKCGFLYTVKASSPEEAERIAIKMFRKEEEDYRNETRDSWDLLDEMFNYAEVEKIEET